MSEADGEILTCGECSHWVSDLGSLFVGFCATGLPFWAKGPHPGAVEPLPILCTDLRATKCQLFDEKEDGA